MSKGVEQIKNQINQENNKRDARSSLLGLDGGKNETAANEEITAANEEAASGKEDTPTNENNTGDPFASIAASLGDTDEIVEPKKVLKGIYLDPDVLAVYNEKSGEKKRKRGWGSQLTSDLLRAYFESQGWMDKK